jgi:hypothetical protein
MRRSARGEGYVGALQPCERDQRVERPWAGSLANFVTQGDGPPDLIYVSATHGTRLTAHVDCAREARRLVVVSAEGSSPRQRRWK